MKRYPKFRQTELIPDDKNLNNDSDDNDSSDDNGGGSDDNDGLNNKKVIEIYYANRGKLCN